MTRLHPIVARESGESLTGYVSRLAWVNGRSMIDFCLDMGISYEGLAKGCALAVRELADLVGATINDLSRDAFVRDAKGWHLRGERLQSTSKRWQRMWVCVACLQEDAAARGEVGLYQRAIWSLRSIRTCPHHALSLTEVNSDSGRLCDFAGRLDSIRTRLADFAGQAQPRAVSGMEAYLLGRLDGRHGDRWIDSLEWHSVAKTCEHFGAAAVFGRTHRTLTEDEWYHAGCAGFDVVGRGEDGILACLASLQSAFALGRSRREGPQAVYGRLYRWLASGSTGSSFDPVRDIVGRIIEENFPLAAGDQVFGRVVERRSIHSIRTASLEVGAHPKRLRKLLAGAGIIPACTAGLSDHRVRFDADAARPLLDRLRQSLSTAEAGASLNAGRVQTSLLIRHAFIRPFASPAIAGVKSLAFSKEDLDRFQRSLLERAVPVDAVAGSQGTIPSAAKRACCGSAAIVAAILDGTLEWVGALRGVAGFMSVIVEVEQVRSLVRGATPKGLTKREVERRLRTHTRVVDALCAKGILPVVSQINPVNRCPVALVDESALAAFEEEFELASTAARERGLSLARLRKDCSQQGIQPAFRRADFYVDIFRRVDFPA